MTTRKVLARYNNRTKIILVDPFWRVVSADERLFSARLDLVKFNYLKAPKYILVIKEDDYLQ